MNVSFFWLKQINREALCVLGAQLYFVAFAVNPVIE